MQPVKKLVSLLLVIGFGASASAAEDPNLDLYAGQVKVLPTKPVKRVAIGNGKVVSSTVVDGKELLLLGEAEGETSLRLWFKDGSEAAYRVMVAPKNIGRAAEEMRELLGTEHKDVQIRIVGDKIVVDGKNIPPALMSRISALGGLYPNTIVLAKASPFQMEKMVWLDVNILEMRKSLLENFGVDWTKQIAGPFVGYGRDFVGPRNVPTIPLGQDLTQPPVAGSGIRLTPPPPGPGWRNRFGQPRAAHRRCAERRHHHRYAFQDQFCPQQWGCLPDRQPTAERPQRWKDEFFGGRSGSHSAGLVHRWRRVPKRDLQGLWHPVELCSPS